MGFGEYLITEERNYLGSKVGTVLTAMQDLQSDMQNLGSRHIVRVAEQIVSQIRRILHSQWTPQQMKYLKELQKIAVAIQNTMDQKGDLKEIIPAAAAALSDVSTKLGVKVNTLDAPEEEGGQDVSPQDFQLTGNDPQQQQQQQPQMPDPQQPMFGQMGEWLVYRR